MVNPANQPAERHFMLDVIDTFPGGLRARAIRSPQEEACDDLHHKGKSQHTSRDVSPARTTRNRFIQRFMQQEFVASSVIKPIEESFHWVATFSGVPVR